MNYRSIFRLSIFYHGDKSIIQSKNCKTSSNKNQISMMVGKSGIIFQISTRIIHLHFPPSTMKEEITIFPRNLKKIAVKKIKKNNYLYFHRKLLQLSNTRAPTLLTISNQILSPFLLHPNTSINPSTIRIFFFFKIINNKSACTTFSRIHKSCD